MPEENVDAESIDDISFNLTQEEADALKLEASNLPPKNLEILKGDVKTLMAMMRSKYGPFMSKYSITQSETAHERVVATDWVTYEEVFHNWRPMTQDSISEHDQIENKPSGTHGHRSNFGYVSFLPVPTSLGDEIRNADKFGWDYFNQLEKEALIKKYGPEEKAKEEIVNRFIYATFTHEVLHQMHHPLPTHFTECAVEYYQRDLDQESSFPTFFPYFLDTNQADAYKATLERYGDDVHRMFFGSSVTKNRYSEILHAHYTNLLRMKGQGKETFLLKSLDDQQFNERMIDALKFIGPDVLPVYLVRKGVLPSCVISFQYELEDMDEAEKLSHKMGDLELLLAKGDLFFTNQMLGSDTAEKNFLTTRYIVGGTISKVNAAVKAINDDSSHRSRKISEALGIPESSVEAQMEGTTLDVKDIPEEERQGLGKFVTFPLSEKSWRQELTIVRNHMQVIQKEAQDLYQTIVTN